MVHGISARQRGQAPLSSQLRPHVPESSKRRKVRRKSRRPKLPRMTMDTRFTLPGIVREIDAPSGPRVDFAFFSLPLMKGGAR